MFGIGQFANIAKVSVRALRHYDEVGLLHPARVDASTGYRYYVASQLPALNRILALKDLGFTLAEITRMVEVGIRSEELVGMLRLRQAEVERAAEVERRRLSRVAARIDLMTGALNMNDLDTAIVVKPLDAVRVAITSESATGFDADFGPIFANLYPRLFAELGRLGVAPAGPTYGLYDERLDGDIDVIAGVVIPADAVIDSKVIRARELPAAARAVTLVHRGSMETITESYANLGRWMEVAGESAVGISREVYLECPQDDPAAWITELQFVLV